MTDNSNPVLPATGVPVRSIDRPNEATTPPVAVSGVTQVVQLDVAGATGPEALVSRTNPMPTDDVNLDAAQTSDGALGTFITGDPNGDFKGVNIIEEVINDASGLAFSVKVINPPKAGADGGLMLSDCPVPLVMRGAGVFIFDTQGYQSWTVTTGALSGSAIAAVSNDLVTWNNTGISLLQTGSATLYSSTTLAVSASYIGPCSARYLRFTLTSVGQVTLYLRAQPIVYAPVTSDIRIAGITAIGANLSGSLAVGGAQGQGTATSSTTHPLTIAGADVSLSATGAPQTLIRTLRTDASGRQVTAPLEDKGAHVSQSAANGRQQGVAQITTIFNNAAANVQDTSQFEGQSIVELLGQILFELRIANQQRYETPQVLAQILNTALQGATTVLPPVSLPDWDEPTAYRADSTIFN